MLKYSNHRIQSRNTGTKYKIQNNSTQLKLITILPVKTAFLWMNELKAITPS
jgi:hypothetical protein